MTLVELRKSKGKTQKEVAKLMGVSQGVVSRFEKCDNPKVSTIARYLKALGADMKLNIVYPK